MGWTDRRTDSTLNAAHYRWPNNKVSHNGYVYSILCSYVECKAHVLSLLCGCLKIHVEQLKQSVISSKTLADALKK